MSIWDWYAHAKGLPAKEASSHRVRQRWMEETVVADNREFNNAVSCLLRRGVVSCSSFW